MTHTTRLPFISSGPTVPVGGQAEPDKARQVFERMKVHPEQKRVSMTWDAALARAALERCKAQAMEGWDGHIAPNGFGPNWWVRSFTHYKLPDYSHDREANNIESLCHGGMGTVEGAWAAWMGSSGHKQHILGELDFYAKQVMVGVAYFHSESSKYKHYYAVISCPPE